MKGYKGIVISWCVQVPWFILPLYVRFAYQHFMQPSDLYSLLGCTALLLGIGCLAFLAQGYRNQERHRATQELTAAEIESLRLKELWLGEGALFMMGSFILAYFAWDLAISFFIGALIQYLYVYYWKQPISSHFGSVCMMVLTLQGAYHVLYSQWDLGFLMAINLFTARLMALFQILLPSLLTLYKKKNRIAVPTSSSSPVFFSLPLCAPEFIITQGSFRYPNRSTPSLWNCDMHISAQSHIAVLGTQGSGKKTLAKVLSGRYPLSSGTLQGWGHALCDIEPSVWQSRFLILLEQAYWPDNPTSLRRYCELLEPSISQEAWELAFEYFHVKSVFEQFPSGWETPLSFLNTLPAPYGQRLAYATWYFSKNRCLIVEQSHLSTQQHGTWIKWIQHLQKHNTVVVLTTQRTVAALSERILILSKGQAIAFETPERLFQTTRV